MDLIAKYWVGRAPTETLPGAANILKTAFSNAVLTEAKKW